MAEVERLSKRRSALRNTVMKSLFTKTEQIMETEISDISDKDKRKLREIFENLKKKEAALKELDDKILEIIEPDEMENDMEETVQFELDFAERLNQIRNYLELKDEDDESTITASSKSVTKPGAKLPTLNISKFDGDPLQWQAFIDSFEASVHSRSDLSPVQKFQYLNSYLINSAKKCVEGFPLTNDNYEEALDLLKKRYGNPQLVISAHMSKIMQVEKIKAEGNALELRNLLDTIESHVRSLGNQGVNKDHFGALLIPIIQEKLPAEIRLQISRKMGKENWQLDKYLDCLKDEIEARDNCKVAPKDNRRSNAKIQPDEIDQPYTIQTLLSTLNNTLNNKIQSKNRNRKVCLFCKSDHYSDQCKVVTDVNKRFEIVKSNKCCFKCLRPGHGKANCTSKYRCFKCKSDSHHTAICKLTDGNNEGAMSLLVNHHNTNVLLQTAQGNITDVNERKSLAIRVLFDSCSQRTYISNRVVNLLSLEPKSKQNVTIKTFGKESEKEMLLGEYEFCLKTVDHMNVYIKALSVPTICSSLAGQRLDLAKSQHSFLNELLLADNGNSSNKDIDLLIGADFYWSIVNGVLKRDDSSGLVAISTKLGWLVSGPVRDRRKNGASTYLTHVMKVECCLRDENAQLNDQVKKFWDLDTVGIKEDEVSVYHKFLEDITFKDCRYEVRLPIKEGHPELEDQYRTSYKRLENLKQRLKTQPGILKEYDRIFQEQLREGIIEVINDENEANVVGKTCYLPHREVVRNDKKSTKVRVVFDASSKGSNGVSLNSCLYKGPLLNQKLFDLWVKFRSHEIALTADIEKAYLQISVHEDDRNLLRFLWYRDVFGDCSDVVKMRFCRVIFGATSSQFLLNGTVRKLGDKYENIDPEFARKVREHFYVDDLNTGVRCVSDGVKLYKDVKSRFLEGSFNVRKWRTNNAELRNTISESENAIYGQENLVEHDDKVLGITWNDVTDKLIMDVQPIFQEAQDAIPTKRNILKIIASVYDPMGFLQPIVVKLKILFQKICREKIDWDERIDGELLNRWSSIITSLETMEKIYIDRCYCIVSLHDPVAFRSLHGFSDASELAYGACVYMKTVKKSNDVDVSLITSKSRLVPLNRKYTIPRLELLGNYILSKLFIVVSNALKGEDLVIDDYRLWSDSKISIAWINAVQKELKTFCQNRVIEIRKNTDVSSWSYCKSADNPADIITRLIHRDISEKSMWWKGPDFLYENTNQKTQSYDLIENKDIIFLQDEKGDSLEINTESFYSEVKNHAATMLNSNDEIEYDVKHVIQIEKYSDINKLLRVTSYVMRFIRNAKKKERREREMSRFVTVEELRESEILWLKDNQKSLSMENNFHDLEKSLCIQKDSEGLHRSMKRIINADLPYDTRAPILLSRRHRYTELLVWNAHKAVKHMGVRQTLTELRKKFWITKGRSYIKHLLIKCTTCQIYNSRPCSYPASSNLPSARLSNNVPFSGLGVDYLGPLFCNNVYKKCEEMHKCYVVIYTCASTRGVVLDVVKDGSAKTFVDSFTRFIARRGCPVSVLSDNGSSFKADETQQFASSKGIEWKFNVEGAPWYGGFWERLVATVKRCLKKTIGKSKLSFDELQTVMLEIENVINSRPLCYLYDDDEEEILTPNHLLYGRQLNVNIVNTDIDKNYDFSEERLTNRKRYLNTVLLHFWKRWSAEYLTSLRERSITMKSTGVKVPHVNDVVLVYDDKQPRQSWKLGRIIQVLKSKDDQVRSAKVELAKTKNVIGRPVNRLYPIEVSLNADYIGPDQPRNDISIDNRHAVSSDEHHVADCAVINDVANELKDDVSSDGRDVLKDDVSSDVFSNTRRADDKRSKRNAALIGEIKRKFVNV